MKQSPKEKKYKLIYNPNAGAKRKLVGAKKRVSPDDIFALLQQYQIPIHKSATKYPEHATQLAKQAVKEGFDIVLVAGGDGTISEAAQGLVGTQATLGILPLGTYMNTARMLSIPINDLEKAVALIKIGRTRKIDVGMITQLEGRSLTTPSLFMENAGIGFVAELHKHFAKIEKGNLGEIIPYLKRIKDFYSYSATIILDNRQIIETKASVITVSNGPYTAAAFIVAPTAKLNDHMLTISIYKMSRLGIFKYLIRQKTKGIAYSKNIQRFSAKKVKIITSRKRLIHADGRLFGTTPVEFKILPNALNIITGFPKQGESALKKKTPRDPK
jgi:YegS/Rv2252/BmrU family lipid kinase